MNFPDNEIVVLDITGDHARLASSKPTTDAQLLALGFVAEGDQLVKSIADLAERQSLVNKLIELGALFSAGAGWSPAELVDLYKEQGVVKVGYKVIAWRGPDNYKVTDR